MEKVERTPQDAISLFGLFGFRGHHIGIEESQTAMNGKQDMAEGIGSGLEEPDKEASTLPETEIYPHGEEVAVAFGEDLYPGATQYFSGSDVRSSELLAEVLQLRRKSAIQRYRKRNCSATRTTQRIVTTRRTIIMSMGPARSQKCTGDRLILLLPETSKNLHCKRLICHAYRISGRFSS